MAGVEIKTHTMIGFLDLNAELLDSMLLRILGGEEGDDLGLLLDARGINEIDDTIENATTSQRVRFVAHKPRRPGGTQICTSLDGNTYPADDPNIPAIPQHFSCRSQHQYYGGAISGS